MMSTLRKYLIAGLLVWIPLAVTIFIIKFVIDLMDMSILFLPDRFQPENLWGITIPGAGLILALVIVIITGALAANLIGRQLVDLWEKILGRIPLVRNIYNAIKQITTTLLASDNKSFRKAVLIEFPKEGLWSIGFLTNPSIDLDIKSLNNEMVGVFVSTTPNPTTGFFVIIPSSQIIELDISVEEAFKMIMSVGVVVPGKIIKEALVTKKVAEFVADS